MMNEQGVLSFGGSWTEEKLEILRKYLRAYTTALKNTSFDLVYIDAFAGTGYCGRNQGVSSDDPPLDFEELREEDTQAYITGSARIALEVEPAFQKYVYIDLDPSNCVALAQLKDAYPCQADRVEVVNADANAYIQNLLHSISWRSSRAVLFLDPFGMEVHWDTVHSVAQTGAVDLWYLFPISAVNRMLMRSGALPPGWVKRLNSLFGSDDWQQEFYSVKQDQHLYGESQRTEKTATWGRIISYIVRRLQAEFPKVVVRPRILRNPRTNTPLYVMCFAAANSGKGGDIALKIATHIMK